MNDKGWRYRVMLMVDMGRRYSFRITMWKELYDVTFYRCVTLSCDTGCQSCKRPLNTAQIFQWHAIKYSISNQIRRWSSIEIYKISGVSHVFNFSPDKNRAKNATFSHKNRYVNDQPDVVSLHLKSVQVKSTSPNLITSLQIIYSLDFWKFPKIAKTSM